MVSLFPNANGWIPQESFAGVGQSILHNQDTDCRMWLLFMALTTPHTMLSKTPDAQGKFC